MLPTTQNQSSDHAPIQDPEMTLLLLRAIAEHKYSKIDDYNLGMIAYLLDRDRVVDFSYTFRFAPQPHSSEMQEDLSDLHTIGFINFSSPVSITDDGVKWIDARLDSSQLLKDKYNNILTHKPDYLDMNADELFVQSLINPATRED